MKLQKRSTEVLQRAERLPGNRWRAKAGVLALLAVVGVPGVALAESCTTQSQMTAGDRDALEAAARSLAGTLQAGDLAALQAGSVAELQGDFAGVRQAAQDVQPHLQGDTLRVDSVYLLDATGLAAGADAQFYCTLNRSQAEADFSIRGLTPGTYGFAVVLGEGSSPWRVSLLMRREGTRWLLAGFFPGPTEAAGHDGLWYWREARRLAAAKQPWSAWLLYGQARALLVPAPFVQSTHLERLDDERKSKAPPALSAGVSAQTPLVVKGSDGKEYRFTDLGTETILSRNKLDVSVGVQGEAGDAAALRAQSDGAARALLAAYPELCGTFGGVLVALSTGANTQPLVTEHPAADIP